MKKLQRENDIKRAEAKQKKKEIKKEKKKLMATSEYEVSKTINVIWPSATRHVLNNYAFKFCYKKHFDNSSNDYFFRPKWFVEAHMEKVAETLRKLGFTVSVTTKQGTSVTSYNYIDPKKGEIFIHFEDIKEYKNIDGINQVIESEIAKINFEAQKKKKKTEKVANLSKKYMPVFDELLVAINHENADGKKEKHFKNITKMIQSYTSCSYSLDLGVFYSIVLENCLKLLNDKGFKTIIKEKSLYVYWDMMEYEKGKIKLFGDS